MDRLGGHEGERETARGCNLGRFAPVAEDLVSQPIRRAGELGREGGGLGFDPLSFRVADGLERAVRRPGLAELRRGWCEFQVLAWVKEVVPEFVCPDECPVGRRETGRHPDDLPASV